MQPASVRELIAGSTVLLTGATGFVGGLLLERLLRISPGPEKVFVLVRRRKGVEPQDRVREILSSPLFSDVPSPSLDKVQAIPGDVAEDGLGLSSADRQMLVSRCTIVFHSAAFISFAARLDLAVRINLLGSRQVLHLAREMPNIKAMVYISTAYANCTVRKGMVEEKLYPTPCDPAEFLDLLKDLSAEEIERRTPELIGNHPNTYTFTKQMAEALMSKERGNVALSIIRPSIVLNTWRDPRTGWVDNVNNGACGFIAGVNKGLFRTFPSRPGAITDVIPADMVVSAILAAALQAARKPEELHIYHCTSSAENPVTWGGYCEKIVKAAREHPCVGALWLPEARPRDNPIRNAVVLWIFQILPAYLLDFSMKFAGQDTPLLSVQQKYARGCKYTGYFTVREWTFSTKKASALSEILPPEEREACPMDPKLINWDRYLEDCVLGMRQYFHKEPPKTTERARLEMKRLKMLAAVTPILAFFFFWALALVCGCSPWMGAFLSCSLLWFLIWV